MGEASQLEEHLLRCRAAGQLAVATLAAANWRVAIAILVVAMTLCSAGFAHGQNQKNKKDKDQRETAPAALCCPTIPPSTCWSRRCSVHGKRATSRRCTNTMPTTWP